MIGYVNTLVTADDLHIADGQRTIADADDVLGLVLRLNLTVHQDHVAIPGQGHQRTGGRAGDGVTVKIHHRLFAAVDRQHLGQLEILLQADRATTIDQSGQLGLVCGDTLLAGHLLAHQGQSGQKPLAVCTRHQCVGRILAQLAIVGSGLLNLIPVAQIHPYAVAVFVHVHLIVSGHTLCRSDRVCIAIFSRQVSQKSLGGHTVGLAEPILCKYGAVQVILHRAQIILHVGDQHLLVLCVGGLGHRTQEVIAQHIVHPLPLQLHVVGARFSQHQAIVAENGIGIPLLGVNVHPLHGFTITGIHRIHIKE